MSLISADRSGVTRYVVLVGRWALKFPRMNYGWRQFLHGLLANMQEATFSKSGWPELCPVIWRIPGGFLVVMKRARPLTDDEWDGLPEDWAGVLGDYVVPVERKSDSSGVLDGRVVAVDYGN